MILNCDFLLLASAYAAEASSGLSAGADGNIHLTPAIFTLIISGLLSIVWILSWKILNRIEKKQEELMCEYNKLKDEIPKLYVTKSELNKILELTTSNCKMRFEDLIDKINILLKK
jgi:hypothetical protein